MLTNCVFFKTCFVPISTAGIPLFNRSHFLVEFHLPEGLDLEHHALLLRKVEKKEERKKKTAKYPTGSEPSVTRLDGHRTERYATTTANVNPA